MSSVTPTDSPPLRPTSAANVGLETGSNRDAPLRAASDRKATAALDSGTDLNDLPNRSF